MKVNGNDDIPYMKWKIKFMFETTNQMCFPISYFHIFSYDFPQRFPTISHWNPGDELEDLVERRMSMGSNGSTSMIQNMTWGCPAEGVVVNWTARTAMFGAVMIRIMVIMMMMMMMMMVVVVVVVVVIKLSLLLLSL